MLRVEKISTEEDLKEVFSIRNKVFVEEQEVASEDEYDEFENISSHFLATLDGVPVGTARWRITEKGVKLERFAVLKEARGKGVGHALVETVLTDIKSDAATEGKVKYLHAQIDAVPLYSKFNFKKVGDIFEECNILHYKMQLA
ncbi:putative GNAT family N-acyltransferase [Algoriphagus iocasae]|jgi:predicted GNAT family N-acyltransferase|uniref:Putative GNAT family N-acyltransferase n=1 Tax=Algoriphagus iocasae TaxID=1836499 RepID=A0A841MX40_9BACT|nr:GNAT family N-acetyltransferase [Algoriphagus iocasae]MBB6328606.1 putative GNAT family N-acyltransferase [Algoriphagus iocasae]